MKSPDDQIAADYILQQIKEELESADDCHGPVFHSPHEGYAVIKEELEEMWDAIKDDHVSHSCREAIQVAAMAVKYIREMRKRLAKEMRKG